MKIRIKYFDGAEELKTLSVGDWIDLSNRFEVVASKGDFMVIKLGVAMELPEGYEAHIAPRSSTFRKYGIIQTNSVGVVDHSYCGDEDEWGMPCYFTKSVYIPKGTRLCQFRIVENQPQIEFEVCTSLGNDNRGGFGSTGD